jgi:hypothetical protein
VRYVPVVAAIWSLASIASADVANGIYRGTSQTTVKFLDPATLAVRASRRFSRKVSVTVGKPLSYGGTTETSPFHWVVGPTTAGDGLVAGDLFTASARTASIAGNTRLLQYWFFQNTQSGFTGAFINSHLVEGAQRDRLVAPLGSPDGALKAHRLHDGSVAPGLQVAANGLVNGAKMTLTITGFAYVKTQAIVSFRTVITAKKASE